jgi:hypothetical protein
MNKVVLALAMFSTVPTAEAQVQNKDQVSCIRTLTADAAKVGQQQGKANLACLKTAGAGQSAGMAQECLTADASGKVDAAADKAVIHDVLKCEDVPNFGYAGASGATTAGMNTRLQLFADLFGSDLDGSAVACTTNADACACQAAVAKAADKLQGIMWKSYATCQKSALVTADAADDLAWCVPVLELEKVQEATTKLAAAVEKKCTETGVLLPSFGNGSCDDLPGPQLASCIAQMAECRACAGVAQANAISIDCDLLDGRSDGGCGNASLPDPCNPLSPPGQQGCDTGEKCTWVALVDDPEAFGTLACVADGTVTIGGSCVQGEAGETTGHDNCSAGGICTNGVCRDVCGFDGSPNSSCPAGEACVRYENLGANGDGDAVMGACHPTCDLLHQTRVAGGVTTTCGAGMGCYPVVSAADTIAVCAGAGTPTHNMPITGKTYSNSCAPGHVPRQAVQGVSGNECAGLCKPADVYNGSNDGRSGRPDFEGGNSTETNWMSPPRPATCESAGGASVLPAVPTTGESCQAYWTRETAPTVTAFSNSVGWCFNHASWRYDPDGAEPINNTDAYPRCINTTTGDVLPPVNASMPHNDAIYFGCMSIEERPADGDHVFVNEPLLDRIGPYR